MTPLAAYLLLFVAVGIGFIFVHLMAGKFIRPNKPDPAKGTIYECGEPTIGSAWIQFDLRFYVVALLFVIFDVEVAFFFPWAVVFGKANAVQGLTRPTNVEAVDIVARGAEGYRELADRAAVLVPPAAHADHASQLERLRAATSTDLRSPEASLVKETVGQARSLAWLALVEILVFFGVLLVGFAYLWRRGDLAWVRSLAAERSASERTPPRVPLAARQPAPKPLASTHS
jgi:NADH-quinone oxidoreductase subunit A